MTMLTLNADEHAVRRLMHNSSDETRGVVFLRPTDFDEWLHTKSVEAARAMLHPYPARRRRRLPNN
ncbi:hypothetical protein WL28_11695 [Burkholderia ubonensis]|nr:hypothetical protein WJ83_18325 [Burkholderia ubonensis]KVP37891.1 hypothetical protein WJ87_10015 [Burkholderia ubonensis]KVT84203.1 hypothetical protein WK58_31200 [Burkholderia ubonensis]KWA71814.1 hypothetical protein WL28_11695 [Burkholderia ubonensis]